MNAVEQIMEAFGANPASSSATLFGAAATSESDAVEFASQISAALQNSDASSLGTESPWRVAQTSALESYSAADFEALASIKGLAPEIATLLQGAQATQTTDINAIEETDAFAAFASNIVSNATPQTEGILGLQLVQFTGLELSSLVDSGQLQPLNGDGAQSQLAGDALFLFAAGSSADAGQPVRLIPIAQLEPFNNLATSQQLALGEFVPTSDAKAAALATAHLGGKPAVTGDALATPNGVPGTGAASATASPLSANLEVPVDAAKSASEASPAQINAKHAPDNLVAKLEDGAQQAKADNKAVEGHLALAETKQANVGQNQSVQGQIKDTQTALAANQVAANQVAAASTSAPTATMAQNAPGPKVQASITGEAQRTKQGGLLASRRDQALAAARINMPAHWATDQLAGLPENALLPDAVSGGLTGLRGEPSFMNSMGLTASKSSAPSLTGQVATQINLHVSKAVKNGSSEFSLRLNPSELGAVRVKMAFNEAGRVSAQLFAERPETLELLQREMRGIERAVEAGGHKVAQNGLSFELDADDGHSAGKAFAEAAREDQLKDKLENSSSGNNFTDDEQAVSDDLTDLAMLDQILSRVSADSGLDVRV